MKTGYHWIRRLAKGGMGRVDLLVRAEGSFRRLCAVKRLTIALQDDHESRVMFLDEARVAGMLKHPNVVGVFDVGEENSGPFFMMDFVHGLTCRDLIKVSIHEGLALPVAVVLQVILQASKGLHAAHELRSADGRHMELVHRDVSPHNIMVSYDGIVRVMDFGVARSFGKTHRTSTGLLKGKVGYMAPEQLRFRPADRRSDIFALGVVFFELLALRRLYPNEDDQAPLRILEEGAPDIGLERDDVPDELVKLLFEMLAKEPQERPQNALEVAQRCGEILADLMFVEEEAIALPDYLQTRFDGRAQEEQGLIREALERLDRGELPTWPLDAPSRELSAEQPITVTQSPSVGTGSRKRFASAGALVLALGAVALGGAYRLGQDDRTAEVPPYAPLGVESPTVSLTPGGPVAIEAMEADVALRPEPLELELAPEPVTPRTPRNHARRVETRRRRTSPPSPQSSPQPSPQSSEQDSHESGEEREFMEVAERPERVRPLAESTIGDDDLDPFEPPPFGNFPGAPE